MAKDAFLECSRCHERVGPLQCPHCGATLGPRPGDEQAEPHDAPVPAPSDASGSEEKPRRRSLGGIIQPY